MGMRTEDQIKKIIIHCTDSDDSLDIGFKEINDWHRDRGFLSPSGISCGYHYIIRRDGTVEEGRSILEVGAHAKGFNTESIGIVWVGKKDPSDAQYKQLLYLTNAMRYRHKVDVLNVKGHFELPGVSKTCPNLNMHFFRGNLLFGDK